MRLLAVLRALRPRVWVTTPQGALDLLARLYLEFNVDPMELDLEKIVLVGEIASAGAHRRLIRVLWLCQRVWTARRLGS